MLSLYFMIIAPRAPPPMTLNDSSDRNKEKRERFSLNFGEIANTYHQLGAPASANR